MRDMFFGMVMLTSPAWVMWIGVYLENTGVW